MPRPVPLGNFEVLGFRRHGFSATRTPLLGFLRAEPRSVAVQGEVDHVAPSIPASPVANAQNQTTIRVMWAASTDAGSGLAGYRVFRATSASGPFTQIGGDIAALVYDDTSLSPSQTRYYYVVAFDAAGNVSAASSIVNATTSGSGGSGNDEVVGSYANINLSNQVIYRINSALGDVPVWTVEGAVHTYLPTDCWDGGPCHRVTPIPIGGGPTGQGNAGVGTFYVRRSGLDIRKLNVRWEFSFGSTWITRLVQQVKWVICYASNTATGDPNGERPMLYLSDMDTQAGDAPSALQRGDLMAIGVASGTSKNFEPLQAGYPGYNWPRGREDFYWGPSATTISGKRVVPLTDWYTCELELIGDSVANWPGSPVPPAGAGLIRIVIWNRAGEMLTDLYIPWDWDGNWSAGDDHMTAVEIIGGYGNATTVDSNTYQLLANFTFAANRPGLIGPRSGFVS